MKVTKVSSFSLRKPSLVMGKEAVFPRSKAVCMFPTTVSNYNTLWLQATWSYHLRVLELRSAARVHRAKLKLCLCWRLWEESASLLLPASRSFVHSWLMVFSSIFKLTNPKLLLSHRFFFDCVSFASLFFFFHMVGNDIGPSRKIQDYLSISRVLP